MPEIQSKRDEALTTLYMLIEQTNGAGFFKRLADLDQVRAAFSVITTEFDNLEKLIKDADTRTTRCNDQRKNKN